MTKLGEKHMSKNYLEMELEAITLQESRIKKIVEYGQENCLDTTELEEHLTWLEKRRKKLLNEKKF